MQSELSEEEIDIIVIGEPNVCYAMGYSNMKDLKQCLIKDDWDGISTNIRTEDWWYESNKRNSWRSW